MNATHQMLPVLSALSSIKSKVEDDIPISYRYTSNTKIVDIFVLSTMSLVGTIGNILILTAVASAKELQTLPNIFVVNLALADLIVTAYLLPISLATVIIGVYPLPGSWCVINGLCFQISCGASIMSMACIAADRYFFICRQHLYNRIFTCTTVTIASISIWVYTILLTLPLMLGWGEIYFGFVIALCAFDPITSKTYAAVLLTMGMVVPAIVTIISYFNIFRKVKRSREKVKRHLKRQAREIDSKIWHLLALFCAFVLFIVFWTPFSIVTLVSSISEPNYIMAKAATWIGLGNSSVNSFIYGIMNKNFRKGYRNVICCCKATDQNELHGQELKGFTTKTT